MVIRDGEVVIDPRNMDFVRAMRLYFGYSDAIVAEAFRGTGLDVSWFARYNERGFDVYEPPTGLTGHLLGPKHVGTIWTYNSMKDMPESPLMLQVLDRGVSDQLTKGYHYAATRLGLGNVGVMITGPQPIVYTTRR